MEFILSVMGSNWETLSKEEIQSAYCFIKIILTAMLRKDFREVLRRVLF